MPVERPSEERLRRALRILERSSHPEVRVVLAAYAAQEQAHRELGRQQRRLEQDVNRLTTELVARGRDADRARRRRRQARSSRLFADRVGRNGERLDSPLEDAAAAASCLHRLAPSPAEYVPIRYGAFVRGSLSWLVRGRSSRGFRLLLGALFIGFHRLNPTEQSPSLGSEEWGLPPLATVTTDVEDWSAISGLWTFARRPVRGRSDYRTELLRTVQRLGAGVALPQRSKSPAARTNLVDVEMRQSQQQIGQIADDAEPLASFYLHREDLAKRHGEAMLYYPPSNRMPAPHWPYGDEIEHYPVDRLMPISERYEPLDLSAYEIDTSAFAMTVHDFVWIPSDFWLKGWYIALEPRTAFVYLSLISQIMYNAGGWNEWHPIVNTGLVARTTFFEALADLRTCGLMRHTGDDDEYEFGKGLSARLDLPALQRGPPSAEALSIRA